MFYQYFFNLKRISFFLILPAAVAFDLTDITVLELEKSAWRDFPPNLNDNELQNPYIVIKLYFKSYSLTQYRNILYEWLEYGLSSKSPGEFIETYDLIKVYENLQKLYSAAWLIYQRLTDKPYLKFELQQQSVSNSSLQIQSRTTLKVNVYKLQNIIPLDYRAMISKIISTISHKVPSVQTVIYLGVNPVHTLYLLVLTSDDEQRQAQGLSSMIEESCRDIASIVALVHHASSLFTGLNNDHIFFNEALKCPVIYLSGDLLLPVPKPSSQCIIQGQLITHWKRWHDQGNDFLLGAEYYLKIKAHSAALFFLHQCVECLLIAIIRAVLGYRVNNHNLSRLLNITEMFTSDLATVFNLADAKYARLFDILKHAYVNVRYKDVFEPDLVSADALYQVAKEFMFVVNKVHEKHLLTTTI